MPSAQDGKGRVGRKGEGTREEDIGKRRVPGGLGPP